ncbi:MAG: oligopeptidase B, partial [Bacteroidia bacterium]|nr:oligopeptidase B [Bacteroidia bacterium]
MTKYFHLFALFISCGILSAQELIPPETKKIPSTQVVHGDTLTDNYYWLRDKFAPEVINHLYEENTYAGNVMKSSTFLQKVLYEEFKSRHKEGYSTRPTKYRGYLYYTRIEKDQDYAISCRKKDSLNAPEQVVLDLNKLADGMTHLQLGGSHISPDQHLLYYGIDNKGNRVNNYYLKNIETDSVYKTDELKNVMSLIWAEDNKTVYYTKPEEKTLRQYRVYKHVLGTNPDTDVLIFEEANKTMNVGIATSTSKEYIFIGVSKTKSTE